MPLDFDGNISIGDDKTGVKVNKAVVNKAVANKAVVNKAVVNKGVVNSLAGEFLLILSASMVIELTGNQAVATTNRRTS
ncbi:MAG: hypothetical protein HQ498_14865 [Pseudohongiella sp.]|nr:hypothetical protein [Pseudohongiella sp.]